MPTVSTKWDIKSLIEHHAHIQIVGKSSFVHEVEEYSSNCPWCPGSTNSFKTRPGIGQYTHAVRAGGCGRVGDAVDFLVEYVGMTRQDAVRELELEGVQFADQQPATRHENSSAIAPNQTWQEAAEVLLKWAENNLWYSPDPDAKAMLKYLYSRGLTSETIKRARLGYVPLEKGKWKEEKFDVWGLDPELLTEDQRKKGCVRIPNGILIPWFVGGKIWKLAMKRPGEIKMPYGQIMGSVDALYNVDSIQYGEIAMMVEGELDCLSVLQEAGDLVNVCATGSTSKGRAMRWITELMSTPSFVLQSFDSDKNGAGDEAANIWIDLLMAQPGSEIETSSFDVNAECTVERWPLVMWKDPNELLQAQLKNTTDGFSVREWVSLGVDIARQYMQQDMNPLARGVSELVEVEYNPFEDGGTPDTVVPSLPEDVQTSPGQSEGASPLLDAYVESRDRTARSYMPVTLPALPRTACPHTSPVYGPVVRGVSKYERRAPCKGKPLAHGWCAEHSNSQMLLELGAKLGYPEVLKLAKYGGRGILSGVACWEVVAEKITPEHAEQDIKQIQARFGL